MNIGDIIRYYRACYQADNRDLTVADFFGNKVEKRVVIEGKEDLLTGFFPHLPIDPVQGAELEKTSQLYKRERELVYCAFFVIGRTLDFQNRTQKLCAPLLFFPASIVQDGGYFFVSADLSRKRLNYSLLSTLRSGSDDNTEFEAALAAELEDDLIGPGVVAHIADVMSRFVPELDTDPVAFYPDLWDEKKLKRQLQPSVLARRGGYLLVPAAGAGLIKKSTDTMGVLSELQSIAEKDAFAPPVRAVFGDEECPRTRVRRLGRVPSILNEAQQQILQLGATSPVSLVIGPPGTGKSYTIASLAIEHMSRGQSVLIASRTDQAVDVIADKIEKQLGLENVLIRAGRKEYLQSFKHHLKNLLGGIIPYEETDGRELRSLERRLTRLERDIAKLEREFADRVESETDWGGFLARQQNSKTFLGGLREKYIHWRNSLQEPHWEIIEDLEEALDDRTAKTIELIRGRYAHRVHDALDRHRHDLAMFLKAASARTGTKQAEYFADMDFRTILRTFPVWLVKLSDLYKVLPLRPELFDLAIVDEATQCDAASVIPVMQRAKRIVFAGDPNQLRHVSFLSRSRQQRLLEQCGLADADPEQFSFRDKSILDVVSEHIPSQEHVAFLNEHYRSTPLLIRFSNRHFYSDALRIMTDKPNIPANEGIALVPCEGTRTKRGHNPQEAQMIVARINDIVESQRGLDRTTCQTLGVLSPFRDQVDYVMSLLSKRMTVQDMEKHDLVVGTAYAFQGEERDVMLLSFVLDDQSHPTAFRHLNRADVFNVSITRARSLQYVFYSVDVRNLDSNSLLRRYIESFETEHARTDGVGNAIRDRFCMEVAEALGNIGYATWPGYPVAGLEIDLIVHHNSTTFGIDLIGYPGQFKDAFSLERYKMLKRAGLKAFPLPYTYWLSDRDRCLAEIAELLP